MYHANDLHTISRITKTWPKLRRLAIYEIQDGITPDTVLAISQRFPSLSRLYLHPWNVESALVVPQCYPRMNTVELAMDDAGLEGGYYEGDGCKQHAITRFTIEEQHEGENTCENLSALLKQNHTTIETMTWDINPHSDDHELYDIQYPLLKQLTLGLSGWWIPQKSPMLQELKIDSRTLSVSAAVFDCIPPNLKKLEFNLSIGEQLDDKTPIAHYLKRLSQHPLLNELVIHFDRSFDIDNVLDAIVCLARLVRLTINLPPATNSSRVQRFLEELTNGCPYLRCLEMKCGHSPTSILALRLLKHLKYLAISVEHPFYPFNYNGFWDDVKELSRLNAFQVTRNMVDNMDDIGYLKAQRPDLKIFVDKRFTRF